MLGKCTCDWFLKRKGLHKSKGIAKMVINCMLLSASASSRLVLSRDWLFIWLGHQQHLSSTVVSTTSLSVLQGNIDMVFNVCSQITTHTHCRSAKRAITSSTEWRHSEEKAPSGVDIMCKRSIYLHRWPLMTQLSNPKVRKSATPTVRKDYSIFFLFYSIKNLKKALDYRAKPRLIFLLQRATLWKLPGKYAKI